jgi:tetratricopeptide (TPR) repeat protein
MRTLITAALILSFLAVTTFAQDRPPGVGPAPAPNGMLQGEDGKPIAGVTLARAELKAVVAAGLAETTITLTFSNGLDRVLGGQLAFPLPDGATVTGYGLDVNGTMVDGVAVEKQRARVVYETEMRRKVDPGLVEHVAGNNFRTRLYPIPARGTRSVKIQYVSPLATRAGEAELALPARWGDDLREAKVRVELRDGDVPPRLAAGGADQKVEKVGNGVAVEATVPAAELRRGLKVILPPVPERSVAIGRRPKVPVTPEELEGRKDGEDGAKKPGGSDEFEHFFVIHHTPPGASRAAPELKHHRVGVVWDASLSRGGTDRHRELKLLDAILTKLGHPGLDVVVLRNDVQVTPFFAAGAEGTAKALQFIKGLAYDGATNLGALKMPAGVHGYGVPTSRPAQPYDLFLLFSDGLGNLGPDSPPAAEVPVYAFSNDDHANPGALRVLCQQSGGAYWNLKDVSDERALAGVGSPVYSLVSTDFKEGEIAEVFPAGGATVQGRVTVSGRLLAPEAKVTLNYGFGKEITHRQTFTLKASDAAAGTLVPRFWAQEKVAELSLFADKNADELAKVGKAFNLVTPSTSLLVLETADQYVRHRVVPPRDRPDVYREFLARIEQNKAQEAQTKEQKVRQVLAMWDQRVKWWETDWQAGMPARVKEEAGRRAAEGNEVAAGGRPGRGGAGPRRADPRDVPAKGAAELPPTDADRIVEFARRDHVSDLNADVPDFTNAPDFSLQSKSDERSRAGSAQGGGGGGGGEGGGGLFGNNSGGSAGRPARPERGFGNDGGMPPVKNPAGAPGDVDRSGAIMSVRPWDPQTPYLAAMRQAGPKKAYGEYLQRRKAFGNSPAFYLDCADYLLSHGERALGVRVLSNVAELQIDDPRLLRVAAHRLNQVGEREAAINLFEKVLRLRPEEPQSHRDLALALADRADEAAAAAQKAGAPGAGAAGAQSLSRAKADYGRALDLLNNVVTGNWDRFAEIEVIALMEANRILSRLGRIPNLGEVPTAIDPRLRRPLDLDVRIVLTWDADATDVDLWVTEPTGTKCFYQLSRTAIGGLMSRDFTEGYGPEEYCLRRVVPGEYKIQANFYGSRQQELTGPCTVQATVITNFGRADEKRQALTVRLASARDVVDIGSVKLGAGEQQKQPAGAAK